MTYGTKDNLKFLFQPYKTLVSLGHAKLFDENIRHDYSKMTKTKGLFISNAIHKATIEVDKEGTVAAAVTRGNQDRRRRSNSPFEITVDKPFLFFIRSENHVIFAGRMVHPTKITGPPESTPESTPEQSRV